MRTQVAFRGAPAEVRLRTEDPGDSSYQAGVREGERTVREALLSQRAELVQIQQGVLKSLAEALPKVIGDCEDALIELALTAAQRVVGALPISRDMVESAVREALRSLEQSSKCEVLLHPDDLALLTSQSSDGSLNDPSFGCPIQWIPSESVSRGGCVVRYQFGIIDGQRETKFRLLHNALKQ